jgi:hypothetical protein
VLRASRYVLLTAARGMTHEERRSPLRPDGRPGAIAAWDAMKIYFLVFFARFPEMALAVFFGAAVLPAGALVKCSLTLAAS